MGYRKPETLADSAARFKESGDKRFKPDPAKTAPKRRRIRKPEDRRRIPANEGVMVEEALRAMSVKKGKRAYPTDTEVIRHVHLMFRVDMVTATAALRGAKAKIAERINTILPTLGQNVISELQENIQEARRVGDLATAGRCLIALGRFAGLDQPQVTTEQQVRQLSDAALEAALEASIARKLDAMPDDQFEDMRRRREERRLAGAKQAALGAPLLGMPKEDPVLDVASEERA